MSNKTNIAPFALCALALAHCLVPGVSFAKESVLVPEADGVIHVRIPMLVDTFDSMSIPAGATVEFSPTGSIFVKGSLRIGLDGAGGRYDEPSPDDLLQGVIIRAPTSTVPIGVRGGGLYALNVKFSGGKFMNAFAGSDAVITSSSFETSADVVVMSLYQKSRMVIRDSTVKNSIPGSSQNVAGYSNYVMMDIFDGSYATMTAMTFESPRSQTSLSVFGSSTLRIDDSYFRSCDIGISAFNFGTVRGVGNHFDCIVQPYAFYRGGLIDLKDKVPDCCARVIFLPGLQGTRLYRRGFFGLTEQKLWEPGSIGDIEKLFMDSSGKPLLPGVYIRDIIEKANVLGSYDSKLLARLSPPIYAGFVAYLKKLTSEKAIAGYSLFPYDWRMSPVDIAVPGLIAAIRREANLASNGRVILIAHSYGGLVAKEAMTKLYVNDESEIIQSAILVAVPESGAPQAIFSALHGVERVMFRKTIANAKAMARLAMNMPSAHFLAPSRYFFNFVNIRFSNSSTGVADEYKGSTDADGGYSLISVYNWLVGMVRKADDSVGYKGEHLSALGLSHVPSLSISSSTDSQKSSLYRSGRGLENAIRTYSIVGLDVPTLAGMKYWYAPCLPFPKSIVYAPLSKNECSNVSKLDRISVFSNQGDGTVIFDGKDRRLGKESFFSLREYNARNGSALSHADILESSDIQSAIGDMIRATSTATTSPYGGGESGVGGAENPWFNTRKTAGMDITGYVEGDFSILSSFESAPPRPFSIITLDAQEGIQAIDGDSGSMSGTAAYRTSDGWSFGSADSYGDMSLRSLKDQSISIVFSESVDIPPSADGGQPSVESSVTESFLNIPVGAGSVLRVDTQYVMPDPVRVLTLDVDADGIGDMAIPSRKGASGGLAEYPKASLADYASRVSAALRALAEARVPASRLEIYALRRFGAATIDQTEFYIRAGNPALALLALRKRQIRLAEISEQYRNMLLGLQKGLSGGFWEGFRYLPDRAKKEAEIAKIRAYMRDLARLKVILFDAEARTIDLLS